jgi:hypothetical protein
VAGGPGDFAVVAVDTGPGDDQLAVLDCSFGLFFGSLGTGDDTAAFDGNTFDSAVLDGGPGDDRLTAAGNTGSIVSFNFEDETITP